jgi:hypothetical protein
LRTPVEGTAAGRLNLLGNDPDLDIRHHIFRREFAIMILRIHP